MQVGPPTTAFLPWQKQSAQPVRGLCAACVRSLHLVGIDSSW